ncbi:hypothetical protein LAWI1_G008714, partial [Lachnellula willkommii]
ESTRILQFVALIVLSLIRVHCAIICPRSQTLSATVDSVTKEALSQEIFLEEDEPLIVAQMIEFFILLGLR